MSHKLYKQRRLYLFLWGRWIGRKVSNPPNAADMKTLWWLGFEKRWGIRGFNKSEPFGDVPKRIVHVKNNVHNQWDEYMFAYHPYCIMVVILSIHIQRFIFSGE